MMHRCGFFAAAAVSSLAAGGCVSSELEGADPGVSEGVGAVPAQPFIDKVGRTWVPIRKIDGYPAQDPVEPDSSEAQPDVSRMSVEELAEHFRPIRELGGVEYTLQKPDLAFAERVQARMKARAEGTLPEETRASSVLEQGQSVEQDAVGRQGREVFGSDNRTQISHTSSAAWPIAINSATVCTFTKVGPDTVITAAHCVHDGSNWFGRGDLRFGARWSAADQFTTIPAGCYSMTVPACWDGDAADCDYAVLNISDDGPQWCPQVNTGYYGLTTSLGSGLKYLYGYPGTNDPQRPAGLGVTWNYPQLFGHANDSAWQTFTYPDRVFYSNDASGGQSGTAIWRFIGVGRHVVAIHKGQHCGLSCSNQGRDIDSDLIDWFDTNGGALGPRL